MQKPTILIHAYTHHKDHELSFWRAVAAGLSEQGRDMFMVGSSHRRDVNTGFPYAPFREYLDQYVPMLPPADAHPAESQLPESMIEALLAREILWTGEGQQAQRRAAIHHVYALYSALLSELKPAGVLVMNGQHPVEMILIHLCQQHAIPVAYLERGPFPFSLHIDPKAVTAGSEVAQRRETWWGDPAQKQAAIENFKRYEQHYLTSRETWWAQPENNKDIRKELNIPVGKKIILFANQLDNDTSNFLYSPLHPTNLAALQWLVRKLEPMRDKVFLLGKHHPVNHQKPDAFRQAVGSLGVWTEDYPLESCLGVADYVAAVNSTVLFEALMHGKPSLQIGQSILSNKSIAYEVTSLADGADDLVVADWLERRDLTERIERWRELGGSLLADTLCFQKSNVPDIRLRNAGDFVARLIALFPSLVPSGNPVAFQHMKTMASMQHLQRIMNDASLLSRVSHPVALARALPSSIMSRIRQRISRRSK
jgi:hypothetical protein